MRLARSHWVKAACRFRIRGEQSVVLQKVGQRQQAEARAGLLQKIAAVGEFLITSAVMAHSDVLTASGLSDNCLVLSSPGWSLIVAEDFKQPVRPGDLRSTHLGMTSETAMYVRGVDLPRKKWENDSLATAGPTEIENEFARLSPEAQLSLLERLIHRVRLAVVGRDGAWEAELSAMAADPEMQRELRQINAEFNATEADGLEKH